MNCKNFIWNWPVVKEQLLARLNGSFGKDTNTMVSIDHHYFGVAVGINGVVSKPDLVTLSSSIHNKVCIESLYISK